MVCELERVLRECDGFFCSIALACDGRWNAVLPPNPSMQKCFVRLIIAKKSYSVIQMATLGEFNFN